MKRLIQRVRARLAPGQRQPTSEELLQQFHANGCKPWTPGYDLYKWDAITRCINAETPFSQVVGTPRFGYRIDERIVEYGWLFERLPAGPGVMLDAGSALNFAPIITHPAIASKRLFISTLAPESHAFWNLGVSYVYEDLRESCFRDDMFDVIACISTIEHVGLDNTMLYTADTRLAEDRPHTYLDLVDVLRRLLKPGGVLFMSFPYGAYKNHGWFQVFNAEMVTAVIDRFGPASHEETIFQYADDRWQRSTREQAKDATCFDINVQKEYDADMAAFSRGIACLELVK
ncbi:MAG: class I SAM-dependent methyltransferase [Desulfovibrio sp.]|nr:class I SAM-dependent methyltransferase [Desulfovibrio sp.]